MSENKKPRICEVLGVEVGEEWTIGKATYRITWNGGAERLFPNSQWHETKFIPLDLINHPEKIKRKPRWTADDIADAKAVRRLIPESDMVYRCQEGAGCIRVITTSRQYLFLHPGLFPSLLSGECISLDVILGGES